MPDSNGADRDEAEVSEADKINPDDETGDMTDPDEYGSLTVEDGAEDGADTEEPGSEG